MEELTFVGGGSSFTPGLRHGDGGNATRREQKVCMGKIEEKSVGIRSAGGISLIGFLSTTILMRQ